MIKVNKERLIKDLKLVPSGMRGWYDGNCAFCGGDLKMGIRLYDERGNEPSYIGYNCFSGKCGKSGGIIELLKHIGRLDLASMEVSIHDRERMNATEIITGNNNKISLLDMSIEPVQPPVGFEPVDYHPYLKSRGFTERQYEMFGVGLTSVHSKFMRKRINIVKEDGTFGRAYNEYIISLVKEDGENKAYLGRSMMSQSIINDNNNNVKKYGKEDSKYKEYMIHKYINSVSDFGKLLLGYDEIIAGKTKDVILVEGWFDKSKTDENMLLYDSPSIKAVSSFGKKLSDYQIAKLLMKGIENIVIMHDPDAIRNTKELSLYLSRFFRNVRVAVLKDKDPGDMSPEDLNYTMSNLKTPIQLSRMII